MTKNEDDKPENENSTSPESKLLEMANNLFKRTKIKTTPKFAYAKISLDALKTKTIEKVKPAPKKPLSVKQQRKKLKTAVASVYKIKPTNVLATIAVDTGKKVKEVVKLAQQILGHKVTSQHLVDASVCELILEGLGVKYVQHHTLVKRHAAQSAMQTGELQTTKCLRIGILGHIDHGKTTLLKRLIQKDNISESRGITQSNNIYRWSDVVYLIDTPGHNVFDYSRRIILKIANFVFLVVSAKDGVQDETKKIVSAMENTFSLAAGNLAVILTKMDLAGPKELTKTKSQLLSLGIDCNTYPNLVLSCDQTPASIAKIESLIELVYEGASHTSYTSAHSKGLIIDTKTVKSQVYETILLEQGKIEYGAKVAVADTAHTVRQIKNIDGKVLKVADQLGGLYYLFLSPKLASRPAYQAIPFIATKDAQQVKEITKQHADSVKVSEQQPKKPTTTPELTTADIKVKFILVCAEHSVAQSIIAYVQRYKNCSVVYHTAEITSKDLENAIYNKCSFLCFNTKPDVKHSMLYFDNIHKLTQQLQVIDDGQQKLKLAYAEIVEVFKRQNLSIAGCIVKNHTLKVGDEVHLVNDILKTQNTKTYVIKNMRIQKQDVTVGKLNEGVGVIFDKVAPIKVGMFLVVKN